MKRLRAGFTLIEMGLVLIVLSMLVSGILTIATQNIRLAKKEELKNKMDAIETALSNHRKGWDRLPCPGDMTLADTHVNFGLAAVNAGGCDDGDGSAGNPAAPYVYTSTIGGMVPVKTLGLPDEYAYDPWGGRFLYVVDVRATEADAFTTYDIVSGFGSGTMEIRDASDTARTTAGIAIVISFGPNGHGAFLYGGAQKDGESTNDHELENCVTLAGCTFDTLFYAHANTLSSSDVLDSFDDIVRYYTREQFTSGAEDTVTETP